MQRALIVRTQGGNFDCNQISKLAINSALFPGVVAVPDTHSRTPVISCPRSQLVQRSKNKVLTKLTDDGFAAHLRRGRKSSSSSSSFIGKLPSSACSWKSAAAQHLRLHTMCTAVAESVLHVYSCWWVCDTHSCFSITGKTLIPSRTTTQFPASVQQLVSVSTTTTSAIPIRNSIMPSTDQQQRTASSTEGQVIKCKGVLDPNTSLSLPLSLSLSLSLSRFMMSSCW